MVIATRTDSALSGTITQTSLTDALIVAFTNAGFSAPFDNYTSATDRILVYQLTLDATKTYGSIFLRIRVTTALVVFQQLFATWNTSTKAGTSGSVEVSYVTLSTTNPINFVSLNGGNEFRLVLLTQTVLFMPLGLVAPANRPAWWDLTNWAYGFIFINTAMNTLRTSALNPYANADFDTFLNNTRMGGANPATNRRDLLTGIVLLTQSNNGAGCRSSDDLAMVAGSGAARYDTQNIFGTTQQYLVINPISGGLAVRVQ